VANAFLVRSSVWICQNTAIQGKTYFSTCSSAPKVRSIYNQLSHIFHTHTLSDILLPLGTLSRTHFILLISHTNALPYILLPSHSFVSNNDTQRYDQSTTNSLKHSIHLISNTNTLSDTHFLLVNTVSNLSQHHTMQHSTLIRNENTVTS